MAASEAETNEVMCPDCGRKFATAQRMGAHRARAHGYRRDNGDSLPRVLDDAPPDDQGRPDMTEYQDLNEQELADIQAQRSYEDKLAEFLPALAREMKRRGYDVPLNEAFFILYLDAS